jgi:WD40 repeat protein
MLAVIPCALLISLGLRADEGKSEPILRLANAEGHKLPLRSATYSTDGKSIITRCDQMILRWDAATGKMQERVTPPVQTSSFLTTNDGKWIAAASPNATIQVFETASRQLRQSISIGAGGGYTYGLASDSRTLVVLSRMPESGLMLFDLETGERKAAFELPAAPNREDYVGMLPRRLISTRHVNLIGAGTEGHLTVWDIGRRRQVRSIPFPQNRVLRHAALSPDGRFAAIDLYGGDLAVWELVSGSMRVRLKSWSNTGHDYRQPTVRQEVDGLRYPMALAYSPDGRLLAHAAEDHKVHIWDTWSGKEAVVFDGHRDHVSSVSFSPDGNRLVTAGGDAVALVWDVAAVRAKLPTFSAPLERSKWEAAWTALAGTDGDKVREAIQALAGDPASAVAILKDRVKPIPGPDEKMLAKLIDELNDPKFAVRQKARRELMQLGEQAAPVLMKAAAQGVSAEVRKQAGRILDGLATRPPGAEEMRGIRAVEALEMCGTPEARAILKSLAAGAPAAALTMQAKAALQHIETRTKP